jgi:hypothetical protein
VPIKEEEIEEDIDDHNEAKMLAEINKKSKRSQGSQ